MAMWNPWRGCKKCSDGCLHCYIHKGDAKRNVNANKIVKAKDFDFKQCGTYFIKDSKRYILQTKDLYRQAKLANIDFKRKPDK